MKKALQSSETSATTQPMTQCPHCVIDWVVPDVSENSNALILMRQAEYKECFL